MTNTLKIPGKIVGITHANDGGMVIATETQVFYIGRDADIKNPVFDITDYQEKPTEKELEDIKDQKKLLKDAKKKLLEVFVERQIYGKDEKKAEIADIIAAIAELNKMDTNTTNTNPRAY